MKTPIENLPAHLSEALPFKDTGMLSHKGGDFTTNEGERWVQCQLVDPSDGHAYAIADFEGGRLVRFAAAPRCAAFAEDWKKAMKRLYALRSHANTLASEEFLNEVPHA